MAHFLMCRFLKVRVFSFEVSLFGTLIKRDYDKSLFKNLIITFSGPFVNLFLFFVFLFIESVSLWDLSYFKYVNLSLFLFNMMPYFPLDGASLIKEILSHKKGIINANKLIEKTNNFFLGFICIIFMIFLKYKILNPSFIVFIIFLFTKKNKNKEFFAMEKSKVYSSYFTYKKKIKVFLFDTNTPILDIVSFISPAYYMVCLFFEDDKLKSVIGEKEIIEKLQNNTKKIVWYAECF